MNGSSIRQNCFHQSLLFSSFTITTALIFLNYFSTVLYILFSFLFSSSKKKTFIPIKGNHATAYHIYHIILYYIDIFSLQRASCVVAAVCVWPLLFMASSTK